MASVGGEGARLEARLGAVARLWADDEIGEILVNGPGPVWVERAGRLQRSPLSLDGYELDLLIERILAPLGLRVDRVAPVVDARLEDGSRVNVVVPPLAIDGPAVSIRRFDRRALELDAFGPPSLVAVLSALVRRRASMLIVGPTSSGKTSLIGALSTRIDPAERIVCLEDTAELRLAVPNLVRLEARPDNVEGVGGVPLRQLVLTALRMRPDRLVVGEVRGAEAFDLLLALTSGHRGSLASCHAAGPAAGLRRLETLAGLAGTGASTETLRRMIAEGLDAVVHTERVGAVRRVASVCRVTAGRLETVWAAGPAALEPGRGVDVTDREHGVAGPVALEPGRGVGVTDREHGAGVGRDPRAGEAA